MTKEQQETLFGNIVALLLDVTDDTILLLNEFMRNIPSDQRADVIKHATPLLRGRTNRIDIVNILRNVKEVPEAQRADVIKHATPLLEGITVGIDISNIFQGVRNVPAEQRADVIEHASPLLNGRTNGIDIAHILLGVNAVSEDQRADVIKHASPLLRGITGGIDISNIFLGVRDIPAEQRADVIEHASPLFKDITVGEDIAHILLGVNAVSEDQRADVIKHATPLFKGITNGIDIGYILLGVRDIPAEQRDEIIKLTAPLLEITKEGLEIADTLKTLFFIPPDERKTCFNKIKTAIQEERIEADPGSIIRFAMQDEQIRTNSHRRLETTLASIEEDPQQANALASMVFDHAVDLGLHDEHPLKQLAIDVLTVSSTSTDSKNPYVVFKEHKELATQVIDFTPPTYELEGEKVTFNLKTFQEKVITEVSRENLLVVNPNALSQLIEGFTKRLGLLSNAQKEEVLAGIQEQTGFSLDALKTSCFENFELQNLLSFVGERVGLVQAKFLAIMNFVQNQDASLGEKELLTPQENALLQMGAMIYSCLTGKRDGIAQYYDKLLPDEKKLPALLSVEKESPEMTIIIQLVASVVEEQLATQFLGSGHVIQELTGEGEIHEPPHQALYLRNRIGQFVGLSHPLTFDRHTGVLYGSLREKSRGEILTVFYKHFTPEVLVKSLVLKINADIASGKCTRDTFNNINSLLPKGTFEKVWTLDKDYEYSAITRYGALDLLKLTKYLSEISSV